MQRRASFMCAVVVVAHLGGVPSHAGTLNEGRRVQAGGAGLIILTDPVLDRVVIFDVNLRRPQKIAAFGTPGLRPGQLTSPHGAALNAFRELFVADTLNHRVQVFDIGPIAAGQPPRLLRAWGAQGAAPGRLDTPVYGLAIDNRTDPGHLVFVADTGNHRVQVFDRQGHPTGLIIGGPGSGEGQLERPGGLAFDPEGKVLYVVDRGHRRVCAYEAKTGRFLLQFGQRGSGEGALSSPEGVAVDSKGTIFVADPGGRRVLRFKREMDPPGQPPRAVRFEGAWALVGTQPGFWTHPQSLAIDGQDRLYVSDSADGRCQAFSREGAFVAACGEDLELLAAPRLPEGGRNLPAQVCSNGGGYQVRLLNAPPLAAMNSALAVEVQVSDGCSAPKPLADVSLAVAAVMPEQPEAVTSQAVVEPLGGGRFRVSGLYFQAKGRWELDFDVSRRDVLERAQADLLVE